MLDYAGIVSAYDEAYTSLAQSRQGLPRSKHRLDAISASDKASLVAEVEEVLGMSRPSAAVNWAAIIQGVLDRYAERLEDLRYILWLDRVAFFVKGSHVASPYKQRLFLWG